jgi:FkbM family methyltransferase
MIEPENQFYRELLTQLKSKDQILVFDIGASIGQLTEVFLKENCDVVAVEPHPSNCRVLKLRFRNHKNLCILQKALSNKYGSTTLYIDAEGTSLHTLNKDRKEQLLKKGKNIKDISIETTTLKEIIASHGIPDLLKLDIEGHEKEVLLSLRVSVPIIIFECNLPDFKYETFEIIEHLFNLNNRVSFNFFDGSTLINEDYIGYDEAKEFVNSYDFKYLDVICSNLKHTSLLLK